MKWVQINKVHINTDKLLTFHWSTGQLWLWFVNDDSATGYPDHNRENYLRLCQLLGVRPVEVNGNGKS